jgi:fumarylacetoacetate (FAA) hydrolase
LKLAHFIDPRAPISCLGIVRDEQVIDFRAAWQLGISDAEVTGSLISTITTNLENGALAALAEALAEAPYAAPDLTHSLADLTLLTPVHPPSFRDFYAFEAHVKNARKHRGLEMVPEWYEQPVFYFSNAASIVGHEAPIRKPPDTNALDYELEIGAIIGREGGDIDPVDADDYIAGFTIVNDWSARDLQMKEMKVGLGPAKGKDFATSIGPFLVTPDELAERIVDNKRGNQYDLTMLARVNGEEYSRGSLRDMNWTFAELIAQASRNTVLKPGDLIGSGTVGTGCIVEFPEGTRPWLQAGDVVELEVERLGVLRNSIL